MVNRKSVEATNAEANRSGDNNVLIRQPQIFGDFGDISLGLATAWAAAVGGLLLSKRTCLLGKISSNLRPLTLDRRRARIWGGRGKLPAPPITRPACMMRIRPDPDSLGRAERRCFIQARAALGSTTLNQWVTGSASLPKPATDSSLAERLFLRPFLASGGLRFPVSARRHRLQAPFDVPVSGGKNPVPNSKRAG
jgi:hypothetical protein